MTFDKMKAAVTAFFGDMSRTSAQTREGLEELRDDIDSMIESLPQSDEEE